MRREMRKKWWIVLVAPPALVLFGWLFGEIVMHLWNWLMPAIFGLKMITFWQASVSWFLAGSWSAAWAAGPTTIASASVPAPDGSA